MRAESENSRFGYICFLSVLFGLFIVIAALLVNFLIPNEKKEIPTLVASEAEAEEVFLADAQEEEFSETFQEYLAEVSFEKLNSTTDPGLELYRQSYSRSSVEYFYTHITGSKDVALAILTEADKNDIPLSLAFALAYTESRYNTRAENRNSNSTIDRGLFQLNNSSFPKLTEADFFDPYVSAKYGMSHLKFCLISAGNDVSALAMYNAGTNRVRSNKTPQTTLNYVGKIMTYQKMLDGLFEEEVKSVNDMKLYKDFSVALSKR